MSEKHPVDSSLQKIKIMLQILGFTFEDRPRKRSEIFILTVNYLWLLTDAIAVLGWIFKGVFNGRNFIELTQVTPSLTLGMNSLFKSGSLLIYAKKVHLLVNNLRDMERERLADNSYGHKMVDRETKYLYLFVMSITIVNLILLVFFDFAPLVLTVVKYFYTNEVELFLPFLDVYPFDCYDLRIWPFAYIHQLWTGNQIRQLNLQTCAAGLTVIVYFLGSGWLVLAQILTGDYFFYVCCTHIKIQFQLLQHEVENVIPNKKVSNKLMENAQLKGKFNEFVKWHQTIISCADVLEEIYSKSTLLNYLTSSIIICLSGFLVTTVDNKAVLLTFSISFVVGMAQIFFLCFFGDMLMMSSTAVSQAVYNCNWYLADVDVCKSALIMQIRSQTPCKVTAAGFADVNLNAFMKIVSSSWSYFTLLRTMYDK